MKLWTLYAYKILNQNKASPSFNFVIRGKRRRLDIIVSRQCRNFMHNTAVMSTSLSRHTFPRKARQDTSGFLYRRDWMRNFVCNKWSQDCTCLLFAIFIYICIWCTYQCVVLPIGDLPSIEFCCSISCLWSALKAGAPVGLAWYSP